MNTTRIYDPDEQNASHFQMATWYGDSNTPASSIPVPKRLQIWGDEEMFSISVPGGDGIMVGRTDLVGLKLMLDEYETWLEEH